MASLITQVIIVVVQIFIVKKVFRFSVNYNFIGTIALYIILIIGVVKGIQFYVTEFIFQFILFVLISGVLALVMRIINLNKMVLIFRDKEL